LRAKSSKIWAQTRLKKYNRDSTQTNDFDWWTWVSNYLIFYKENIEALSALEVARKNAKDWEN
jgi:hypothetical protein